MRGSVYEGSLRTGPGRAVVALLAWSWGCGVLAGDAPVKDLGEEVRVEILDARTSLDRFSRRLTSRIQVATSNAGPATVLAPLRLSVHVDNPLVQVDGAHPAGTDGETPPDPYYDLILETEDVLFPPGSVITSEVVFLHDAGVEFTYSFTPYGPLNRDPVARAGGPYRGAPGTPLLFDASASTDPDGQELSFWWDFGDGSTATGPTVSHAYAESGLFLARVSVEDRAGGRREADAPVSVIPSDAVGLARTRVLGDAGHPLGGVGIDEHGPSGTRQLQVAARSGFVTLGGEPGVHRWRFHRPGHLPVWRTATLGDEPVAVIPNPRLPLLAPNDVTISPIQEAGVSTPDEDIEIRYPANAFPQFTEAGITALTGQNLPGLLPPGWSPLQAFHLQLSRLAAPTGTLEMVLWDRLGPGETAALAIWDEEAVAWTVHGLVGGSGEDTIRLPLVGAGTFALAVGDTGATAPPSPIVGDLLPPSVHAVSPALTVTASGQVDPPSSAADTDPRKVTGLAMVAFEAEEPVPSGLVFRGDVDEDYRLRDGTAKKTPGYEHFVVAYQRPGDNLPRSVHARFPVRPRLLLEPASLQEAIVRVDVYPKEPFSGGVIDEDGGAVQASGAALTFSPGDVAGRQAVEIRSLDPGGFAGVLGEGHHPELAFELNVDGMVPDRMLEAAFKPLHPDASYLLLRLVFDDAAFGLQPVERFRSDASGGLQSVEGATAPRLPGVNRAGQYLLVRLDEPQGLVTGKAGRGGEGGVSGLTVYVEGQPWLAVSADDGAYHLLAPAGTVEVLVFDPVTGDEGRAMATLVNVGVPLVLDLDTAPTGPEVVSVDPPDAAMDVRRATPVAVTFSEPIQAGTFVTDGLVLTDPTGGVVAASLSLDLAATTGSLYPIDPLQPETSYRLEVSPVLADLAGLPIVGSLSSTFTTEALPVRGAGAQLTIYEPGATNCPCKDLPGFDAADGTIVCVVGSQGTADPGVPVILVNDNSGETATVDSEEDGSFEGFIRGTEDDLVSAVFVNGNGTTVTLPVTRQLFDDGRVGLYASGGILEAESDGGPVQVLVEPAAVPRRNTFKLDTVDLALLQDLATNHPPEGGTLLGGIELQLAGDELNESLDIVFPVDPADLPLEPGDAPEELEYLLCEPVEIGGVTVYSVLDRMHYDDGELRTASPPYPGLGGGALGPILAIPIAISKTFVFQNFVGAVVAVSEEVAHQVTDDHIRAGVFEGHPISRVPGAVVTGGPIVGGLTGVRSGAYIARANSAGFYTLSASLNVVDHEAMGLRAQSFRFTEVGRKSVPTLSPLSPGIPLPFTPANIVIPIPTGSAGETPDGIPPRLAVSLPQSVLPVGTEVTVEMFVSDNRPGPQLNSIEWLDEQSASLVAGQGLASNEVNMLQGASTSISANRIKTEVTLRCEKSAVVVALVSISDGAGNAVDVPVRFRFGAPLLPDTGDISAHDEDDDTAPLVTSILPGDGAMVRSLDEIIVRFSEAMSTSIESGGVSLYSGASGFLDPEVRLTENQLEARIFPGPTFPDQDYTLTLDTSISDLSGNSLEETVSVTFRTPPADLLSLNGLDTPVAAQAEANHIYILDRGLSQGIEGLLIYDIEDPNDLDPVGTIGLPPYPRTFTLIPEYAYQPSLGGQVVTGRLAVVTGGVLGQGHVGQWMWVVDVSDPTQPRRVASQVLSVDFAAPATVVKWAAPYINVAFNPIEGGVIQHINLQAFILGANFSIDDFRETGGAFEAGTDANGDGDFVDEGDTLPVPNKNGIFGLHFSTPAASGRPFYDFDMDTERTGFSLVSVLGRRGDVPSRLQVHWFLGAPVGTGSDSLGAVQFTAPPDAYRVKLAFDFPAADASGRRILQEAALVARGRFVDVFDLGAPEEPKLVSTLDLGEQVGQTYAIERIDANRYAFGTDVGVVVMDRDRISVPVAAGDHVVADGVVLPTPMYGRVPGLTSIFSVVPSGRVAFYPPDVRLVQIPTEKVTDVDSLLGSGGSNVAAYVDGAVESRFLLPASLEILSPGQTASDIEDPPVPAVHHYAMVRMRGTLGEEVPLAVESLTRFGRAPAPMGDLFPAVLLSDHVDGTDYDATQPEVSAVVARRLSSDPNDPLYNVYLSSPIVTVRELVSTNQQEVLEEVPGRQALWSGEMLRVSMDHRPGSDGTDDLEGDLDNGTFVPGLGRQYFALCGEYIDSPNPAFENTSPRVAGVTLHSGEFSWSTDDFFVPGRGQDLLLRRTYQSRSTHAGPFGYGWDFNYASRICEIPLADMPPDFQLPLTGVGVPGERRSARPGDVLLVDGLGSVFLYRRISELNGNLDKQSLYEGDPCIEEFEWTDKILTYYESPAGHFTALFRFTDGHYALVAPNGARTEFTADGRLLKKVLDFQDSEVVARYRADGRLDKVEGDRGESLEVGYYGRTSSSDFQGADRAYNEPSDIGKIARLRSGSLEAGYAYDDHGRLETFTGPDGALVKYGYDPAKPSFLTSVGRGGDGTGNPRQRVKYADGGLVESVEVNGQTVTFGGAVSTFADRQAVPNGVTTFTLGDSAPQQAEVDATGQTTSLAGHAMAGDQEGRVSKVANDGIEASFLYDTNNAVHRFRGNLLKAANENRGETGFSYDGSAFNRLQTMTTPEGLSAAYAYSAEGGNGVKVTLTEGPVTTTTRYNGYGQLLDEGLLESGREITRAVIYDGATDLPSGEKLGDFVAFELDGSGQGLDGFDVGGASHTLTEDDDGNITGISGGSQPGIARSYDSQGRLTSDTVTGSGGMSASQSVGFRDGEALQVESATESETGLQDVQSTFTHDPFGRPEEITTAGESVQLTYDGPRLTGMSGPGVERSVTFDGDGNPIRVTENGMEMDLAYDSLGRVERIESQGAVRRFEYNQGHQLRRKTVEESGGGILVEEDYAYDGAGRVTTITSPGGDRTMTYWPDGEIYEVTVDGASIRKVERDSGGRVTEIATPGVTTTITAFDGSTGKPLEETVDLAGASITRSYAYDGEGFLSGITTPAGLTSYAYDGFGNLKRIADPDGVKVEYAHSPMGLPLSITFSDGTGASMGYDAKRRLETVGGTSMGYDDDSQVVSIDFPDGSATTFVRSNGNPYMEPDQVTRGDVTQFLSWTNGRLARMDVPNTSDTLTYAYDALGRSVSRTLNAVSVGIAYNDSGFVESETIAFPGTLPAEWRTTVNPLGHVEDETYPSGLLLHYAPDDAGQASLVDGGGVESITWTGFGLPGAVAYDGGIRVLYSYDQALRPTDIEYALVSEATTQSVAGFSYAYTAGGRVLSEERHHENAFDVYTRNSPAEGMRVTGFEFSAADSGGSNAAASVQGITFNEDSEIQLPSLGSVGGDPRGFFPSTAGGSMLTHVEGMILHRDGDGAVTRVPVWVRLPGQTTLTLVEATLDYDGLGMLRAVDRSDGVRVEYTRDGQGRIVEREVTGLTQRCRPGIRRYFWKQQALIEVHEHDGTTFGLIRRYVYIDDALVLVERADTPGGSLTPFIPLVSPSGGVGGFLTPAGNHLETITYSAYGFPAFSTAAGTPIERSSVDNTLLFQGAWFDEATGLYQMGQRNLHPFLARFLQRDAVLYESSRALFTALNGDPAGLVDPLGSSAYAKIDNYLGKAKDYADKSKKYVDKIDKFAEKARLDKARTGKPVQGAKQLAAHVVDNEFASPEMAKTVLSYISEEASTMKTGLSVVKAYADLGTKRTVLDSIRAATVGPDTLSARMGFVRTGGANADAVLFKNVGLNRLTGNEKAMEDIAFASGVKGGNASAFYLQKQSEFREAQRGLRLNMAKGVIGLANTALKSYYSGQEDTRTGKLALKLGSVSQSVINLADQAHEVQKLVDANKYERIAKVSWHKRDAFKVKNIRKVRSAYSAAFQAGMTIGDGLIFLAVDPDVYKAYEAEVKTFKDNGGFLTTFSGVLSTVGWDDAAYSIQQYHDYKKSAFSNPLAFVHELQQQNAAEMEWYMKGLDAP